MEAFHAFLPTSKGQHIRSTVCSYKDRLTLTFSYDLKEPALLRGFFRQLSRDGLHVKLESNGVNYE